MKALLVNPSLEGVYCAAEPLWAASLAARIAGLGHSVEVLDLNVERLSEKAFLKRLHILKPEIIGISAFTCQFEKACNLKELIEIHLPDASVEIGGVHQFLLNKSPEDENASEMEGSSKAEKSSDKGYRGFSNSKPLTDLLKSENSDYENWPRPLHEILPWNKYRFGMLDRKNPYMPYVETSKGGPSRYPLSGWGDRKLKVRNISIVIDELKKLCFYQGASQLMFVDENFCQMIDRTEELLRMMLSEKLNLRWHCGVDCNSFASVGEIAMSFRRTGGVKHIPELMQRAGCRSICFPVISGANNIRKSLGLNYEDEAAIESFTRAKEQGIRVGALIFLGLPGENRETIRQTEKLIDKIKPDWVDTEFYINFNARKNEKNLHQLQTGNMQFFLKRSMKYKRSNATEIQKDSKDSDKNFEDALNTKFRGTIVSEYLRLNLINSRYTGFFRQFRDECNYVAKSPVEGLKRLLPLSRAAISGLKGCSKSNGLCDQTSEEEQQNSEWTTNTMTRSLDERIRVLLVNPKVWGVYCPGEPLSLAHLAAYLDEENCNLKIIDLNVERISEDKLRERIRRFKPDIAGITSFTCQFGGAVKAKKIIRSEAPDCFVVLGGMHASLMPEYCLKQGGFDALLRGPGETSFKTLVEELASGRKIDSIPGIFIEEGNRIIGVRSENTDISNLRRARHELLPWYKYAFWQVCNQKYFPFIEIERRSAGNVLHVKNPHSIICRRGIDSTIEELKYVYGEMKAGTVALVSEDIAENGEWLDEFCSRVRKECQGLKWMAGVSPESLNKEKINMMKSSGCAVLTLVKTGENWRNERFQRAFSSLKKGGITSRGLFFLGLPDQKLSDLYDEAAFIGRCNCDYKDVEYHIPQPGTITWEKALKKKSAHKKSLSNKRNKQDLFKNLKKEKWHLYQSGNISTLTGKDGPPSACRVSRETILFYFTLLNFQGKLRLMDSRFWKLESRFILKTPVAAVSRLFSGLREIIKKSKIQ